MIIVYAMALAALAVVGYLAHDFYNEQIRTRVIHLPPDKSSSPPTDLRQ